MATLEQYEKLTRKQRSNRYFSESFKRKKVDEIDRNLSTVAEISREYQVSRTAIHKWIQKYSLHHKKQIRQVIEMKSDTKKIAELKARIKELEQLVGQKQIQLEFSEKMVEIASEHVGFDLKKKFGKKPSIGSSSTGNNTSSK